MYEPASWLFGPNLMTIFGPLLRPPPRVPLRRERWELSDGDFGEADRIVIAGCSLGGNVLVKWLGEQGADVPPQIRAAAALSVPFDLAACARTLDSNGFWRWVYRTRFLRTLKRKSLLKHAKFPDAFDAARVRKARTLFDFDDAVTAAVHGFKDAPDYYTQSSSRHFVQNVRIPLLLLSAK